MTEKPTPRPVSRPVVVGVDGSPQSWGAVEAAVWEAGQRRLPLVLAYGYPQRHTMRRYGWAPPLVAPDLDLPSRAAAMLEETAGRVRRLAPDLPVKTHLSPGSGAKVLVEESHRARLVVVGARGEGGFRGLCVGSVAAQTAAHAACPVIVIRPPDEDAGPAATAPGAAAPGAAAAAVPHPGPVLVGVDGSTDTEAAVEFALEAAALRQVPVIAIQVWWAGPEGAPGPGHDGDADEDARRALAELMAGWSTKFPDVPLELRPEQSASPSYQLIKESAEAGLVVVGSRGRGGLASLVFGSVGRDLIRHAHAPVAVVHPGR